MSKILYFFRDNREKVDPADFTIENISGEEVGRIPGKIDGQQFIIQNCQSSQIYLFDHLNTITVDDCSDCVIFIGPTTGRFVFWRYFCCYLI